MHAFLANCSRDERYEEGKYAVGAAEAGSSILCVFLTCEESVSDGGVSCIAWRKAGSSSHHIPYHHDADATIHNAYIFLA